MLALLAAGAIAFAWQGQVARPIDSARAMRRSLAPEHGLTTDQVVNIANAVFAFFSALAAMRAVSVASAEATEQRRARREDRERALYERLVLDVALDIVPAFRVNATDLLEGRRKEMQTTDLTLVPHQTVVHQARGLTAEFNEDFFRLKETLRNIVIAWGDRELEIAVDDALQTMQDAITPAIASLAGETAGVQPFGPVVGQHSAALLNLLVSYGLAVEPVPEHPTVGRVRRFGRWLIRPFRRSGRGTAIAGRNSRPQHEEIAA